MLCDKYQHHIHPNDANTKLLNSAPIATVSQQPVLRWTYKMDSQGWRRNSDSQGPSRADSSDHESYVCSLPRGRRRAPMLLAVSLVAAQALSHSWSAGRAKDFSVFLPKHSEKPGCPSELSMQVTGPASQK